MWRVCVCVWQRSRAETSPSELSKSEAGGEQEQEQHRTGGRGGEDVNKTQNKQANKEERDTIRLLAIQLG